MNNKCKICSSATQFFECKNLKASYHYCSNCEFISKDSKYILSEENELEIYNKHNNSIDDPRYVEFFYKFLNNAVFDFINHGKTAFDFGSGPSPVLAQILERYHDYKVDIYDFFYSPEKIYLGKKYDLITCTEVMEHLSNPLDYFYIFRNLMKDDSLLSIMTLFHNNDENHFENWHYARDKTHISFFTNKTFEIIAEITGFEIVYSNNQRYLSLRKKTLFVI